MTGEPVKEFIRIEIDVLRTSKGYNCAVSEEISETARMNDNRQLPGTGEMRGAIVWRKTSD
jgi:hypothetical protein